MFVDVCGLRIQYAGRPRPAVDDLSLRLGAGQIGVLLGPSGCGKTTLLRAIAGLVRPTQGEIRIDGEVMEAPQRHVPPEERRIGMVFQDYALFPHMDVAHNVGFGISHLPADRRAPRVAEALALVGLQGAGARMPHELSGGQQQRVALARALAPQPRLLLLDEPFSSLDVELRERLAQEVRVILKAAGATALVVTHDQMEAFAIGDLVGVMHKGRLHQWGDANALYNRPATRFVAGFVGQGAFLPAVPRPGVQGQVLETPLGMLALPAQALCPDCDAQRPCEVLVRPSAVAYDPASAIEGRIERKLFRGDASMCTVRLCGGESVLAMVPSHHGHQVGDCIRVSARLQGAAVFPPRTDDGRSCDDDCAISS
jgi:iron(III) transport system ATP-binding protein